MAEVTLIELLRSLLKMMQERDSWNDMRVEDLWEYGYSKGWLTYENKSNPYAILTRKELAALFHRFLQLERKEAEASDIAPAMLLKDIYSCKVCTVHIAQVYVKGIMEEDPKHKGFFSMERPVTEDEMQTDMERLLDPDKRSKRGTAEKEKLTATHITYAQAKEYQIQNSGALLVDVRSRKQYEEEHLPGAVNHPTGELMLNPFRITEDKECMVLLYCDHGALSAAAGRCLKEAGYEQVYYFGTNEK